MQCPSCHLEQPETNEACEGCGLIFAKWRERHPEAAPQAETTAPPEPAAPAKGEPPSEPTGELPSSVPLDRRFQPLPEREYQEFPVKKFAFIAIGVLVLGVAAYIFIPSSKTGYATALAIPTPYSVAGSATQWPTDEPTWTPVPCGYPFDTCTPTPIATPMTITGDPWKYHGRVLDELHLNPIGGASIIFFNNGVGVTATSDAQGLFQISVPPLSGKEAWEVQVTHPNFREGYWMEDPSGFSEQDRIARAYESPENQHLRGMDGGGGEDQNLVFSLFPAQLNEQEQMWIQNARPSSPQQ